MTDHHHRYLDDMKIDNPWESFYGFCVERESIRIKKESGQPRPWTTDAVLDKYKFTHLFRTDDRTTKEIFAWVAPVAHDFHLLVANLIYARFANNGNTIRETGLITNGTFQEREVFLAKIAEIGGGLKYGMSNTKVRRKIVIGFNKKVWGTGYIICGTFSSLRDENGNKYGGRENMLISHIPRKSAEIAAYLKDNAPHKHLEDTLKGVAKIWGCANDFVMCQMLMDVMCFYPDIIAPDATTPCFSGLLSITKMLDMDHKDMVYTAMTVWNSRQERKMAFIDAEHSLCEWRKWLAWTKGVGRGLNYIPHG